MTHSVVVLTLDGNYASTSLAPVEVFHAAGRLVDELDGVDPPRPLFEVRTAAPARRPVTTPYGLRLHAETTIEEIDRADVVVVPASGLDLDRQLHRYRSMYPWLRAMYESGAFVAGICTGVAYLAEAGLLAGRRATTHWAVADAYARRWPEVDWHPEAMVTEDRRMLCGGGVYAATDLALYLVERFHGREHALRCAKALILDMPRRSQSGYALLPLGQPHDDARIRVAEAHIHDHFSEPVTVERLAALANMSTRTFIRRFKRATGRLPGNYQQTLRMMRACEMLEHSERPVQAVGEAVGYSDPAFFRSLFRRHTGMTPAEYRTRFSTRAANRSQ